MRRFELGSMASLGVVLLLAVQNAYAVTIPTVLVSNPGNPPDTRYIDDSHPSGIGWVPEPFNIGKTEVTNAQYAAFLNAVAKSDPVELYNTSMATDTRGGILRTGSSGGYIYTVKGPAQGGTYFYDDKPVTFVGSGDAMRFSNWLHNNQPTGAENANTTEDGAYKLNGAISNATLAAVTRKTNARWWLPNDDEWYKAAFHKNDGVTGNYWDYPTSNSSVPNHNLPSSDTGNSANFETGSYTTGSYDYPLTNAGAYTLSDSPYGTFDQGGNVQEWTETLYYSSYRGVRGGAWLTSSNSLRGSYWAYSDPTNNGHILGFRVATIAIPEPSAILLALLGFGAILHFRAPGRLNR